ncbi:hypothetical protein ACHAWF_009260 [Thalassiosira exigua]
MWYLQTLELHSIQVTRAFQLSWAFAKAGESNPRLFQEVADDRTSGLNHFNSFNLQDISNTVWAFAKTRESHHHVFHRATDHILSLDNLSSFSLKNCSQISWAYSHVGIVHTALLKKAHNHVEANVDDASLDEESQVALLRAY